MLRVQVRVPSTQLQPVPLIAVAVNPAGRVSVTVTMPLVVAKPELVTDDRISRAHLSLSEVTGVRLVDGQIGQLIDGRRVCVESFAVLASPPPETLAEFVTLAGALLATFTVTVMTG